MFHVPTLCKPSSKFKPSIAQIAGDQSESWYISQLRHGDIGKYLERWMILGLD
jgi:hypothetical protein